MPKEQSIEAGRELREDIRSWLQKSKKSMRELSRRAEIKDQNYICSFLRSEPESWALPNALTYLNIVRVLSEPIEEPSEEPVDD